MPNDSSSETPIVPQEQLADTTASIGAHPQPTHSAADHLGVPDALTPTLAANSGLTEPPLLGVFGRYELLAELAPGGMGLVYKARDTTLGRMVALKMIRSGALARPDEVQRFHREAKAAATLRHPHIVEIYEIGELEGRHYFTMAFAEGGGLDEHLDRFRDGQMAATLVEKIARAVQHAHERGVLHRDLKPANVVLEYGDEPRVCDFGLAKLADSTVELTQTGQFLGTPAYMAPEQTNDRSGRISEATDVWGLGVLLYLLLTGRRPFKGPARDDLLRQIRTCDPPDPSSIQPGVDRTLEAITLKCLAKDPLRRYASAGLLADDLDCWLNGVPTRERPPSTLRRLVKTAARRPLQTAILALSALVALSLAAGIVGRLTHEAGPGEPPPLVLLDAAGAHAPLQWIIGEPYLHTLSAVGEPLAVTTSEVSAAEMLTPVPWDRYRIEAEIRHDQATKRNDEPRFSEVGVFLAEGSARGPDDYPRSLIAVSFADQGDATGSIQPSLWRIQGGTDKSVETHLFPRMHHFAAAKGDSSPWRKLTLEVTPEAVSVEFDGKQVGVMPLSEIEFRGNHLFGDLPGVEYRFMRQSGVGIFVTRGTGTFRSLNVLHIAASERR
jgi:hypothetical protein